MLGDFNVAPEDRDVWAPKAFVGATHVTEPERAAVRKLEEWGLVDAFRHLYPDTDQLYSYWDYRARRLPPAPRHAHRPRARHRSRWPSASRGPTIDRNARKGKQPSDHTPVIIDLDV